MTKSRMTSVIFALGCLIMSTMAVSDSIRFGITAPRGGVDALVKWNDLVALLEKETGKKVELVPVVPGDVESAATTGRVDYVLTNPVLSVLLAKRHAWTPIATLDQGSGTQFSGVIISKKGSGIKTAADVKGKNVMAFQLKSSAAAYVFQVKHLLDKGIDVNKDLASLREGKKQDDIVLAVKAGLVDVGFVKSGLLEEMTKEGKIALDDFEIVDRKNDGSAHIHSTDLYPEWMVNASSKSDTATTDKIKAALLTVTPGSPISEKANVKGFVAPLSLDSLSATLKALKMAPFDS